MNTCKTIALLFCALSAGASLTAIYADPPAAPVAAPAAKADTDKDEEKTFPAQASVAAKTAFGTVPAASPAVKKALEAHALAAAQALIGKPGAFQGTVSKVYVPRNNGRVVLDFDPDYHSALTAVVNPEAYAKFPTLVGLAGKRVLIQGKFSAYHNAPQIELTGPAQVKVIEGK